LSQLPREEEREMLTPGGQPELLSLHGFQVLPLGRVTPSFRKALRRLLARGYGDPNCVVVKTEPGPLSGITHAGGRYVHPRSPAAGDVLEALRELGVEPPQAPFVVAPGECTLYHEWGHHVDRVGSGDDQDVLFSFRWFSRFYAIEARPLAGLPLERFGDAVRFPAMAVRAVEPDWPRALPLWWHAASELFAELFEDWMRGGGKLPLDPSDPRELERRSPGGEPLLKVAFLPGVDSEQVRSEAFRLFAGGLCSLPELPAVRPDFFGAFTDQALSALRSSLSQIRRER
jgi:hypothetical protein